MGEARKLSYGDDLAKAMHHYYAKRFGDALGTLKELRQKNADDEIIRIAKRSLVQAFLTSRKALRSSR